MGETVCFEKIKFQHEKKNVFDKSITIEGKICHMLDLGTAGFSLPAVVARERDKREPGNASTLRFPRVFQGFLI